MKVETIPAKVETVEPQPLLPNEPQLLHDSSDSDDAKIETEEIVVPAEIIPQPTQDKENEETTQEGKTEKKENLSEKIEKLRTQNSKLKKEFAELKYKLEECIEKEKTRKHHGGSARPDMSEQDYCNILIYFIHLVREQSVKGIEQKIQYYKKQIEIMKRQLEGSFNIDK